MLRTNWLALSLLALAAAAFTPSATSAMRGSSAIAAAAASPCSLPAFGPGSGYRPRIHPATFSANVDNPYFPLTPGAVNVYSGTKDGKAALNVFAPTARTAVIDGVTTRVVEDRLYLNGVLEERTSDYYAQDACGNVWYFGEDTATLDRHGNVTSREGSFHAGVDGAQPGVFMEAASVVGHQFRQEWSAGHAEDLYRVLALDVPHTVRAGHFAHTLRTKETTALEPTVVDNKYYVAGIGEIAELSVKGPLEKLTLVEVIK